MVLHRSACTALGREGIMTDEKVIQERMGHKHDGPFVPLSEKTDDAARAAHALEYIAHHIGRISQALCLPVKS